MKSRFTESVVALAKAIPLVMSLWFALAGGARAEAAEDELTGTLDAYLAMIGAASSPTDPGIFKAASSYWLKGVQGNHPAVARFFLLHGASDWVFENRQSAGDYAAIETHFHSLNYSRPWRTRFELARANSGWKITHFEDLTLRPFDDTGATPSDLVLAYLQTMQAVTAEGLETDPVMQQRIKGFYQPGAGFWKGSAVKALPVYLWMKQQLPQHPQVTSVLEAAAERVVTVRFAQTKGSDQPSDIRFIVTRENNRLYITGYENVAASDRREQLEQTRDTTLEAMASTTVSTVTPEALVRSQLQILQQAAPGMATVMSEVMERSEPLWVSSKQARASLGRLIGIYSGLGATAQEPEWELESEEEGDQHTIIARAANPE